MPRHLLTGSSSRNLRTAILLVVVGCLAAALIVATMRSSAATPSNGTLSEANPVLTYDAGPFNVPNQSPVGLGQLDTGPRCNANGFPCDSYALTVSLASGYVAAHPNSGIKLTMSWTDTGSRQSDYDLMFTTELLEIWAAINRPTIKGPVAPIPKLPSSILCKMAISSSRLR